MKRWWLSWEHPVSHGPFTLTAPWWISGFCDSVEGSTDMICAAVTAPDEAAAKNIIRTAHDKDPGEIEWRFCDERADDWSPFCDRFPQAKWMTWPDYESHGGV